MINEVGLYFVDNDLGRIGGDQTIYDLKNFISDAGYHHIGGINVWEKINTLLW